MLGGDQQATLPGVLHPNVIAGMLQVISEVPRQRLLILHDEDPPQGLRRLPSSLVEHQHVLQSGPARPGCRGREPACLPRWTPLWNYRPIQENDEWEAGAEPLTQVGFANKKIGSVSAHTPEKIEPRP